ncbi:MAG: hypothetical protein RL641_927 [Candidatus Parcubacteria bacterium]|jgi:hypothetical protein
MHARKNIKVIFLFICFSILTFFPYSASALLAPQTFDLNTDEDYAEAAAFDGTNVWFVSSHDPLQLIKVNPETGAHTTYTLSEANGSVPSITFDGTNIWVGGGSSDGAKFFKVNTSDGSYIAYSMPEMTADTIFGLIFDGTSLWARGRQGLAKIHPSDGTYTFYTMDYGEGMAFDGEFLWTTFSSDANDVTLLKVDPADGSYTTYVLHGLAQTFALAFDGTSIWVVDSGSPMTLAKVNPSDGTYTLYPMDSGENNVQYPTEILFDGTDLWIATYTAPTKLLRVNVADGSHVAYTMATGEDYGSSLAFDGFSIWMGLDTAPAKLIRWNINDTTTAPVISTIVATPTATTATISWTTDQMASSTVNYGSTSSYGTASTSATRVASHSVTLTGLTAETTYHFQVGGASLGTVSNSTDQTFTTTPAPSSPNPSSNWGGSMTIPIPMILPVPTPLTCEMGGQCSQPATPISPATWLFTRDLRLGIIHPEVKLLQQYLNAKGFFVATSGAGSLGKETIFFGSLTRAALIKFQKAKNIVPAIGYFGPITREYIRSQ